MTDAWNVIGWTAQQPAVIPSNAYNIPWKIPADIDIVTVFGEFHSMDGGAANGYVEFRATGPLTHVATDAVLTGSDFYAVIGQDGKVNARLPATDTTALTPTNFSYDVTVVINRKTVKSFRCSLPKATASVNLNDLVAQ